MPLLEAFRYCYLTNFMPGSGFSILSLVRGYFVKISFTALSPQFRLCRIRAIFSATLSLLSFLPAVLVILNVGFIIYSSGLNVLSFVHMYFFIMSFIALSPQFRLCRIRAISVTLSLLSFLPALLVILSVGVTIYGSGLYSNACKNK
uniref:Uncharacterized protein n=1 Tax=Rhipicephalus zambeziensis TaxID=60191 RepID=A0A224Y520_9ACAR